MSQLPLASIIVSNYNYGRFLRESIDSALAQTFANKEVIVVDDGSTDESREIITSYGEQIIPVLKENGGQASAFNAGFAASRGEAVLFLDADDVLLPSALEKAVPLLEEEEVIKVHWPLWVIGHHGERQGDMFPSSPLPDGDLRESAMRDGPNNNNWPPTSGNLWSRTLLREISPVPEAVYRLGADTYLAMLGPFFGTIRALRDPEGLYRRHENNYWWKGTNFAAKLKREVEFYDDYSMVALRYCKKLGVQVNPEAWSEKSWWRLLLRAVEDIERIIPAGQPFILVDEASWGMDVDEEYHPIPFLERDGQYWGPPPDDAVAIRELERLRQAGAAFIVIAWSALWWLDHYPEFFSYLRSKFSCALEDNRLVVFDLR